MENYSRHFCAQRTAECRIQQNRWAALAAAFLITFCLVCAVEAATITVTTTSQGIADDGECSLQEAIYSANFDFGVAPSSFNPLVTFDTGCAPGSGDDVIVLEAGQTYPMTVILDDPYNPLGPTANPIILSNITIEANGALLVRYNPNRDFTGTNFRAFAVANAGFADPDNDLNIPGDGIGNLTIRNAYIKGFTAKGGNGASGGGGGMGAGGAIYVSEGTLTVESSTFQDNGAGGGNGATGHFGGGGGLAGNGGSRNFASGGGGGARGNGGSGVVGTSGGGGGTLTSGSNPLGGYRCGGDGGDGGLLAGDNGDDGYCPGGGGGAGEDEGAFEVSGDGGNGHYGGGGGGGGSPQGDGGNGGFGGGGGAGGDSVFGDAGDGGFGGGGGANGIDGDLGEGGSFAGDGSDNAGGGGAGLGGAIFNDAGTVAIYNSTFTGNFVVRGAGGDTTALCNQGTSQCGTDAGGAVFSVDGSLTVLNCTMSDNEATGQGGGIVFYGSTRDLPGVLAIHNTIIANNGVRECFYTGDLGQITAEGSGNLIMQNFGCKGMVSQADPQLASLYLNAPGLTPTLAIDYTSPAFNAGDDATCLLIDQRGVERPQCGHCDIGAYEIDCVPQIQVPGNVFFPDTCVGSTSAATLNVCNTGKEDLKVAGITSSDVQFSVTTPSSAYPIVVSPDFYFPFQVTFTPTSSGAKSSTLTISTNDPKNPLVALQATGNAGVASIDVSPDFYFMPTVIQSIGVCQSLKSFPISNKGTCNLTITDVSIAGENGSDFSLSGLPSFPIIVQPGHVAGDGALKAVFGPSALDRDRLGTLTVTYVSNPVSGATTSVTRQMCGEGANTGARVLVKAGGVPLATVAKIQLQRITGNRNKKILDTKDVALNAALQTVTPATPCPSFQYHREYGTVANPIQLLPGSYQVTAVAIVNGKKVSKTVGFSVDTCGFNPNIVINF